MEEIISIIIPVYNAAKYLEEAVRSVCVQTYHNLEIILVDDGSTDGSSEICDKLAGLDERIKTLHKENGGLTAAWKSGMEVARGSLVGFVDSDDYIAGDMYEKLYLALIKEDADIACCGIYHIFEGNAHKPWEDEMLCEKEVYTKAEMEQMLYPILLNNGKFMGRTLQPNRVSKLIRKELILKNMDLCDNKVTVGEDFQFSLSIFPDAKKIVILKHFIPYFYRVNAQSMTGGYDKVYLGKIKYLKKQLERISDCKGVYDFQSQITNDFLCLTILHIKGEIVRNKSGGYRENRKNLWRICTDEEVKKALQTYNMPKLTGAERLFIFWMKHHFYFLLYLAVKLYFRDSV